MVTSYESTLYIDPIRGEVEADINMKHVVSEDKFQSLELFLYKEFNISKISSSFQFDMDITEKSHSSVISNTQMIKLDFKKEFNKGDVIDLFFRYKGAYSDEGMKINGISENIVEMGIYSPWFPITESIEGCSFKTDIKINEQYILLGSPSISKIDGGWRIEQEEPFYDCSFIALNTSVGRFNISSNDTSIGFYYTDDKYKEICKNLSEKISSVINFYSENFGEIRKTDLSIVVLPRDNSNSGGGYNRPGLVVLPDLLDWQTGNSEKYGEGEQYAFEYLSHEIAHLWWNKAPLRTYEDWLNESFAEYSSLLSVENFISKEAFQSKINKYKNHSINLPSILGIDRDSDVAFDTLYMKGPVILNSFREYVGDKQFFELLNNVHKSSVSQTEDFIASVERVCGEEAGHKIYEMLNN